MSYVNIVVSLSPRFERALKLGPVAFTDHYGLLESEQNYIPPPTGELHHPVLPLEDMGLAARPELVDWGDGSGEVANWQAAVWMEIRRVFLTRFTPYWHQYNALVKEADECGKVIHWNMETGKCVM